MGRERWERALRSLRAVLICELLGFHVLSQKKIWKCQIKVTPLINSFGGCEVGALCVLTASQLICYRREKINKIYNRKEKLENQTRMTVNLWDFTAGTDLFRVRALSLVSLSDILFFFAGLFLRIILTHYCQWCFLFLSFFLLVMVILRLLIFHINEGHSLKTK